jgi:ATP-binding cassette subfamily B protein
VKRYLHYIFSLMWSQKKKFLFLIVLLLLETAARLVQPYFYKVIVDTLTEGVAKNVFTAAQTQLLLYIVFWWFIFAVLSNVLNSTSNYTVWQLGNAASQRVHLDGFRKLLQLDYFKHTQKHSSQFAKIVDEADTSVWDMVNWWLGRFFPAILGFVAMLFIALSISWQMTLISISVIPVGLGVVIFMINRYDEEQRRVNKLWNAKHEHLSDQLTNIITYKLNQDERLFMDVQQSFSDRAYHAQLNLNKKWRLVDLLNPDVIARFLVMGVGVFLVKNGTITLGTLFMFMGLLNEILTPLHLLGDILPEYSRRARHIDRFLQLMAEENQLLDPKKPKKINRVHGKIEFRKVSYRYPTSHENGFGIKNLSFTIEPGEHMAIVGHSGAGKSTIMALMNRLVDPTEGQILLDNIDIREFKQEDYHRIIGTVLQEHSMYDETIAQNIAYGKHHATHEEIVEAAKKAAAHDFISKLPKNYDTLTGEKGVRLSGGEKQRISIARAILKDPKIVILDEPTSALDSITEAKVQKGLATLMRGRTAVIIAHRLSTVREADKILVLEDGQLVALGSHVHLMRTCHDYREMVELQTSGFLADEDTNSK